jgi:hypothetical protein
MSMKSRAHKSVVKDVRTEDRSLEVLTRQLCELLGVQVENLGEDTLR